jgi:hypothetical protein
LTLNNAAGRTLMYLIDSNQEQGHYTMQWNFQAKDAAAMSHGIYFLRLETPGEAISKVLRLNR